MNSSICAKNPIHPAKMMILFWAAILLLYYCGPISLTPSLSWLGLGFIFAHILLFSVGSLLAMSPYSRLSLGSTMVKPTLNPQLISALILLGIIGNGMSITHHLLSVKTISLASIASMRALQAQQILHAEETHSQWISVISFLIYPAGFIGMIAGLIDYERFSRLIKSLIYCFMGSIFCAAMFAGTRGIILQLVLLVALSCYARYLQGKPWLPQSWIFKFSALCLFIGFLVYSSLMWTIRAQESNRNTAQYLHHATVIWGATPKPILIKTAGALNQPELTMTILGPVFYLTQSLPMTEKILANHNHIPIMYGSYHLDLVAAILRHTEVGRHVLKKNYDLLFKQNIYGFFTGAWGGLFIDYQYVSLLLALIWGYLAGLSWVRFKNNSSVISALVYVFWIYTLFISFISPPFGFSNSLMIFIWMLTFILILYILKPLRYNLAT